jgi:hypothetical protein
VERPKRRTPTSPGLGDRGLRAMESAVTVPEMPQVRVDAAVGPDVSSPPPLAELSHARSGEMASQSAAKISSRQARASRPPVRVDEVGDRAVAIASKVVRSDAPKLLRTRRELTLAPIDPRDAFVLSLLDGKTNLAAIVDTSGMPADEVVATLERLARLGIVSMT